MSMMMVMPAAVSAAAPAEEAPRVKASENDSAPAEECAAPFVQALAAAVSEQESPAPVKVEGKNGTGTSGDTGKPLGEQGAVPQDTAPEAQTDAAAQTPLAVVSPLSGADIAVSAVSVDISVAGAERTAVPVAPQIRQSLGTAARELPVSGEKAAAAAQRTEAPDTGQLQNMAGAEPDADAVVEVATAATITVMAKTSTLPTDTEAPVIAAATKNPSGIEQKTSPLEARLMSGEHQSFGREQGRSDAPLLTDAFATSWQTDVSAAAASKEREGEFSRHLLERLSGDGLAARLNAAQFAEKMPLEQAAKTEAASMSALTGKEPVEVLRFAREIQTQLNQGTSEMRLKLHPEHLGEVSVRLRLEGDVATLSLRTENNSAREALQANFQQLREAMAQQGIRIDAIDVQLQQQFTATDQRSGSMYPDDQAADNLPDWSGAQEQAGGRQRQESGQAAMAPRTGRGFVDVMA